MDDDIAHILRSWPYQEEGLAIRRIRGADGRPKIQLRVDLGLLQLEMTGRPDRQRPFDCESLLDYYRGLAEEHRARHGWYEGFELSPTDCRELRRESLQYYHRRVCFLQLQEYKRAIADADHNLQILDLLKAFAAQRDDWLVSEQYRTFILGHRVQAEALHWLQRGDPRRSLVELEHGLRCLREVFADHEEMEEFEESNEVEVLQDLQRRIEAQYSIGHRERLEILLDDALRREDPETAADLRARLRQLNED